MNRPELYYAIMNIVDFLALAENLNELSEKRLYVVLDRLLTEDSFYNDESTEDTFNAIADANNVGGVKTWQEMVKEIKVLFENGERV